MERKVGNRGLAILLGLLVVVAACQLTVAGDSLVVTADAAGFVKGAKVIAALGHDPCQDVEQIVTQAFLL